MKVLLIAPKDSPTYLNSLYASLRVQVGTCDLYALDDKQSADISAFFNHFVKLQHYDRIVLMYDGDLKGFDPDKIPDKPLVHLANHVLIAERKDLQVKQSYLDTVLRWFSAEIEQINVNSMQKNLDAWASRNTAGLIPNSGIKVTEDTRLVVQNALLFAAQWDNPFSAESTHQEDFTLAGGKTVKADLMHSTHSIPHATGKGWAAVRLAYASGEDGKDSNLALDVVLPDAGTLPSAMDAGTWAEASKALDKAQTKEVALSLPKLDLTSEPKDLLDFLKDQGFKTVGLDRIAPKLELTQVVQQVRLILDEEGTVAAALSEAAGEAMAAPGPQTKPITFTVDHPYVLRLRDLTSDTALVEAAVEDAGKIGARTVDLTSRPSREAANRLYRRAGFELRETNVYRYAQA